MSTAAILLAAGAGRRFNSKKPKQWVSFLRKPLFLHSLKTFHRLRFINQIVLVVPPKQEDRFRLVLKRHHLSKKVTVVTGGAYRGESVKKGLQALAMTSGTVLIHDTARPMVTADIIRRVQTAAAKNGAALAAWPLGDTLKQALTAQLTNKTIPRKNLWMAQTPQGFRLDWARRYLMSPRKDATDDVELAERRGKRSKVVLGSPLNMKITYPSDLKVCEALARKSSSLS